MKKKVAQILLWAELKMQQPKFRSMDDGHLYDKAEEMTNSPNHSMWRQIKNKESLQKELFA